MSKRKLENPIPDLLGDSEETSEIEKRSKSSASYTGLPPGTPIHVGKKKVDTAKITVISYDKDHVDTTIAPSVEACFPYRETPTMSWINVDGLHDIALIQQLGEYYGLHPLVIEDILNTQQRAKIEMFDEYLVIVIKMHMLNETLGSMDTEQVSIILGRNFVLTFQEKQGDVFESVRQRIYNNKGRIRAVGADYLAYSLIDAVVDGYFEVTDYLSEQIELVEDELLDGQQTRILQQIHLIKRELSLFRRSVWPFRNMVGDLERR